MNTKLWWQIHRETRKNSYYLSSSRHGGGILLIIAKDLKVWYDAIRMPWNKKYNAQQFPGERKSKIQMLWENIVWAWKYRETCTYYFAYGLDLKGHNPIDYVGYSEFRMMRNILNIRERENLMTGYTFNYLVLLRDKFVFYQYCDSLGMPHPKTYGLVSKGKVSWYNGKQMRFEELDTIVKHDMDAFCKETTGELGRGAFALKVEDGKILVNGEKSNIGIIEQKLGNANYIIQERLKNHPMLDAIYPNALNTLKFITVINDDGEVEFYDSVLRFGAGGNVVDNAGQGGIFVGVESDGTLQSIGYYEAGKNKHLMVDGVHPDTNARFGGLKLPYWDEIMKTAIEFHKFFYAVPSIGWDIAITPDGFSFTETGEDWEIPLYQITHGGQREHFYRTHRRALKVKLRRY